jgi:hypothetical protein
MAEMPVAFSTTVDRPPSCIEFLPSDKSYVFIGTYTLEKIEDVEGSEIEEGPEPMTSPQKRSGSVLIMRLNNDIL